MISEKHTVLGFNNDIKTQTITLTNLIFFLRFKVCKFKNEKIWWDYEPKKNLNAKIKYENLSLQKYVRYIDNCTLTWGLEYLSFEYVIYFFKE